MKPRLTHGDAKAAAFDGWRKQMSAREVARSYGININSVYHAARRIGIQLRPVITRPAGKRAA
jgi:hypothetical protein